MDENGQHGQGQHGNVTSHSLKQVASKTKLMGTPLFFHLTYHPSQPQSQPHEESARAHVVITTSLPRGHDHGCDYEFCDCGVGTNWLFLLRHLGSPSHGGEESEKFVVCIEELLLIPLAVVHTTYRVNAEQGIFLIRAAYFSPESYRGSVGVAYFSLCSPATPGHVLHIGGHFDVSPGIS